MNRRIAPDRHPVRRALALDDVQLLVAQRGPAVELEHAQREEIVEVRPDQQVAVAKRLSLLQLDHAAAPFEIDGHACDYVPHSWPSRTASGRGTRTSSATKGWRRSRATTSPRRPTT